MTPDRFDLAAGLAEAALDRSSAWRFAARFAEHWLSRRTPTRGGERVLWDARGAQVR